MALVLAAFTAGYTVASLDPVAEERFERLGDLLSETTKFAALLVFGALITPDRLAHVSFGDWAVAVLATMLVRPAAMLLSLLLISLPGRQRAVAAWFGPKGSRWSSTVSSRCGRHRGRGARVRRRRDHSWPGRRTRGRAVATGGRTVTDLRRSMSCPHRAAGVPIIGGCVCSPSYWS